MIGYRFFRRSSRDQELAQEIRFYLEEATEQNIARGLSPEEARAEAHRKFGNSSIVREAVYRMSGLPLLENLCLDLRYACRTMAKNPAFTFLAVAILGLGIGGTATMFSVVRAVLLEPLPYPDSERLVRVSLDNPLRKVADGPFTRLRGEELRGARSFVAVTTFYGSPEEIPLSNNGDPEALKGARVSANFLDVLGVQPTIGRTFHLDEDGPASPPVAIISYRLYQRRFLNDPWILSKTAILNSTSYSIVGVLPPGFAFPFPGIDVWITRPAEPASIPARFWPFVDTQIGVARLNPQTSLEEARAELDILNGQYQSSPQSRLDADPGTKLRLTPMKDQLVANIRPTLWMLFGAVGFVALIACANVASLLLSRGAWRSREFAVRSAIGAGRRRLVGQLLVESVALSLAGAVLAILLAWGLLPLLARVGSSHFPRFAEIQFDGPVFGFVALAALATGVLSGLFPALQLSRSSLSDLIRQSGAAAEKSSGRNLWGIFSTRSILVAGQIALCFVLLIGATLLLKSIARLQDVNSGFQPANLLTAKVALSPVAYRSNQKRTAFFEELLRRLSTTTGVNGVAAMLYLPGSAAEATNIQVGVQPTGDVRQWPRCRIQSVSPGYFKVLGIPVLAGREFVASDNAANSRVVVVVNEVFAQRFGGGERNLVGQVMREGMDKTGWMEIVGIVADIHNEGPAAPPAPEFYVTTTLHPPQTAYLAIRTVGNPLTLVNAVRSQVQAVDGNQPLSDVATMEEILSSSLGRRRLTVTLLGSFALIALLLAAAGIYGTISYSVAQRTQEIGIRRALGAQHSDILRLVILQGLTLVLVGGVAGISAAIALTRILEGMLFEIKATDPATYVAVAMAFVSVALLSTYVPASRAIRIDPTRALRNV